MGMPWLWWWCAWAALGMPEGQVAYLSGGSEEDLCVCVLDVAGETVRRVGFGQSDGPPRWSPDGDWLAFTTRTAEGAGIAVVRGNGSELRVLSHQLGWNRDPRWSPDGRRLAYAASAEMTLERRLAVYNLDTGEERFWGGEMPAGGLRPVWLTKLDLVNAFSGSSEVKWREGINPERFFEEASRSGVLLNIGLIPVGGRYTTEFVLSTETQTVPLPEILMKDSVRFEEWAVEITPKSTFIAFETNNGGDREIFALGKRGVSNLTNHSSADWNPVWSHEGKWLGFESFRGGRRGIYRAFPETARVFPVAVSEVFDCWGPSWAPGGEWMAFVSDQTGDAELFACDVRGGEWRRLTTHPGPDYAPAWQPKAKKK